MKAMKRSDKARLMNHVLPTYTVTESGEATNLWGMGNMSGIVLTLYWAGFIDWDTRETCFGHLANNRIDDLREKLEKEIDTE